VNPLVLGSNPSGPTTISLREAPGRLRVGALWRRKPKDRRIRSPAYAPRPIASQGPLNLVGGTRALESLLTRVHKRTY